jgi:hypothetical protein
MPANSSCSALGLPPQLPLPDLPDEIPGSTPSDDESAPDSGLSDLFHSLGAGAGAEAGADNDRYYRGGVGGGSGARAGSGSLAPYATGTSSVRWAVVRIGATTLEISTEGHVKQSGLFQPASYGSPHPGTPYRVYTVYLGSGRREQYYVHDLVHKAFVGDPPHGNLTVMPANVGYPHFTPLVD